MAERKRILDSIEHACERFEASLRADESVDVSRFLGHVEKPYRAELFLQLLRLEVHYDASKKSPENLGRYLQRFPDYADEIIKAFSDNGISELEFGTAEVTTFETGSISVGQRVDRFEIVKRLGSGGFSSVFLAVDTKSKQSVALKLLREDTLNSIKSIECIFNEASVLQHIRHPGIPRVHDSGYDDKGLPWVAMEYIKGKSLFELLAKDQISLIDVLTVVAKVADAVDELHQCGFAHRDIKPDNVIVGYDGEPRILDYGLALHEQEQRRKSGERAGTTAFMSPEQVRGMSGMLDGRTDVWSLGVMLYLIVSKRLPFQGNTKEEIQEEILSRPVRPPRQIKDSVATFELEQICFKALKKNPEERFSTAGDFAAALRSAMDLIPVETLLKDASRHRELTKDEQRKIQLASKANMWKSTRKASKLPGLLSYTDFERNTEKESWSEAESEMMDAAKKRFRWQGALLLFVVAAVAAIGLQLAWAEKNRRIDDLTRVVAEAPIPEVLSTFDHYSKGDQDYIDAVEAAFDRSASATRDSEAKVRYAMILAREDDRYRSILTDRLLNARQDEISALRAIAVENVESATLDDSVADRLAATLIASPSVDGVEAIWPEAPQRVVNTVLTATGQFTDRFAWCYRMPLDQFKSTAEALRKYRYRPVCVRPWSDGKGDQMIAAIWHRDGADWEISYGMSAEQFEARYQQAGAMPLCDVFDGFKSDDGLHCFVAIWSGASFNFGQERLAILADRYPQFSGLVRKGKSKYGVISRDLDSSYLKEPAPLLVDVNCFTGEQFDVNTPREEQKIHVGELIRSSPTESDVARQLEDVQYRKDYGKQLMGLAQFQLGNFAMSARNLQNRRTKAGSWEDHRIRAVTFAKVGDFNRAVVASVDLRKEMASWLETLPVLRDRAKPPLNLPMARAIEFMTLRELEYWENHDLERFLNRINRRVSMVSIRNQERGKYCLWCEYYCMALAGNSVISSVSQLHNDNEKKQLEELTRVVDELIKESLRIRPTLIHKYLQRVEMRPTLQRLGIKPVLDSGLNTQWTSAWSSDANDFESQCILPMLASNHSKRVERLDRSLIPVSIILGKRNGGVLEIGSVWLRPRNTESNSQRTQQVANTMCYSLLHGCNRGIWKVLASSRQSELKTSIVNSLHLFQVPIETLLDRYEQANTVEAQKSILEACRLYTLDLLGESQRERLLAIAENELTSADPTLGDTAEAIVVKLDSFRSE